MMGSRTSIPMVEPIELNFSLLQANIFLSDQSYLRKTILNYIIYSNAYLNKICPLEIYTKTKRKLAATVRVPAIVAISLRIVVDSYTIISRNKLFLKLTAYIYP